jgi:hypothetical protein
VGWLKQARSDALPEDIQRGEFCRSSGNDCDEPHRTRRSPGGKDSAKHGSVLSMLLIIPPFTEICNVKPAQQNRSNRMASNPKSRGLSKSLVNTDMKVRVTV